MRVPWHARSSEERALLNPAFVGLLIHQIAAGFESEGGRPLPFVLTFVAAPVVLHGPTRGALPAGIRTSLAAWLNAHPSTLLGFADRAKALAPYVREAILFASRSEAIVVGEDAAIKAGTLNRTWSSIVRRFLSDEVLVCTKAALFVGRWFAQSGPEATVLTLWGVRP